MEKNKNILIIIFIILVGVGFFFLFLAILSGDDEGNSKNTSGQEMGSDVVTPTLSTENSSTELDTDSSDTSLYSDGNYSSKIEYQVPKRYTDSISVELKLSDGVVNSLSVDQFASNDESAFYQGGFEDVIEAEVVGKSLEELSLSRVGGASLTTQAFMDAIDQIRDEAKK